MGLIMKAGCIKPKMPLWPFKATEKLPLRNHQGCVPFSPVLKQRMGILLLAFPWDNFLCIDFMTFQLLSLKSSALAALWGSAVWLEIGKCLYIFGTFWVRWVHKIIGAEWWYHFSPLYFTGQIIAAAQRIGRIQARELAFSFHFCSWWS